VQRSAQRSTRGIFEEYPPIKRRTDRFDFRLSVRILTRATLRGESGQSAILDSASAVASASDQGRRRISRGFARRPEGGRRKKETERKRGRGIRRGSFRARRIDASRPSERGKVPIRFCREAIKVLLILPREARDKIRLPTALVLPIAL